MLSVIHQRFFYETCPLVSHQPNYSLGSIDITSLSVKLGPALCEAIPGFHAFTGRDDYTLPFSYKEKIRPLLKILEKNKAYLKAFGTLGSSESLPTTHVTDLEKCVCEMYVNKRVSSANEAQFLGFMKVITHPDGEKANGECESH